MNVLISGSGIAGLALALLLRKRGLTPIVGERAPRLRDGGHMLGLPDPGLDAAERLAWPTRCRRPSTCPGIRCASAGRQGAAR